MTMICTLHDTTLCVYCASLVSLWTSLPDRVALPVLMFESQPWPWLGFGGASTLTAPLPPCSLDVYPFSIITY